MRPIYSVLLASLLGATATLTAEQEAPVKVACIGDSITFGAAIKNRSENSYPSQLAAMLGKSYEVKNFGVNGATLLKKGDKPYWKLKQFQAAQDFQPDIVVIKLGTNDTKPQNWKHKAEYESDYVEMVKLLQALDSKPEVWICYPVPVFPERWGINDKAVRGEVIPLVDKVAKNTGAKVIDLYEPLKGKPELVPDKVHPNKDGAKVLAETISAAIQKKVLQDVK